MSPMRLVYRPLFRVRLRHAFYADGASRDDFRLVPSPSAARALSDSGLLVRALPDGLAVYAEVTPDSDPATLRRPLLGDILHARLVMVPVNDRLLKITSLPALRPGREILVFDNLREEQVDGRLLLGDTPAGATVGTPVELVTGQVLEHPFPAPVSQSRITMSSRFGDVVHEIDVLSADPVASHRIDLATLAPLPVGRYSVADDGGGTQDVYYDPSLRGMRVFGVVEVFNRTDPLSGVDLVPVAYRFLDGDELTGVTDYHVQLEALTTTWRYNVVKQYPSGETELDELTIAGDATFARALEPDRAVFTSSTALALSESPLALTLNRNGDRLRELPNPGPASQLSEGTAPETPVSELFVYV